MLFQEANELLEIVCSWEIVTTVWPYSLVSKSERKGISNLISLSITSI